MSLNYLGSGLSLWPFYNETGALNIVRGSRLIASQIMTVMLMQPWESPHHSLGLSPELFEPLSNLQPQYWCYEAQREILRWVPGLEALSVYIPPQPDARAELSATIDFTPSASPTANTLTFGWYAYTGAMSSNDFSQFRESISLDGKPFSLRL